MKKITLLPLLALGMVMLTPSCKTSQENYQKAYEITRAKRDAGLTEEELSGMAREEAMPKSVYNGDSIPLKSQYVKLELSANESVKSPRRYTVVVGSMRQLFNAKSLFTRLSEAGYPDAVVLSNAQKTYYIGALTTTSLDSAVTLLKELQKDSPITLRAPFPYILQAPNGVR